MLQSTANHDVNLDADVGHNVWTASRRRGVIMEWTGGRSDHVDDRLGASFGGIRRGYAGVIIPLALFLRFATSPFSRFFFLILCYAYLGFPNFPF